MLVPLMRFSQPFFAQHFYATLVYCYTVKCRTLTTTVREENTRWCIEYRRNRRLSSQLSSVEEWLYSNYHVTSIYAPGFSSSSLFPLLCLSTSPCPTKHQVDFCPYRSAPFAIQNFWFKKFSLPIRVVRITNTLATFLRTNFGRCILASKVEPVYSTHYKGSCSYYSI